MHCGVYSAVSGIAKSDAWEFIEGSGSLRLVLPKINYYFNPTFKKLACHTKLADHPTLKTSDDMACLSAIAFGDGGKARISVGWSGWRDSNSQPLAPKASALPIAPHPDIVIIMYIFLKDFTNITLRYQRIINQHIEAN